MKKLITLIALVTLAVTAVAETYTLRVNDFSRLKIVDPINVDYHQCSTDSAGLVKFTCPSKELASMIGIQQDKDRLILSYTEMGATPTDLPTVHVYSSFLTQVENAGDSLVRVLTVSSCPEFKAKQIGNGRIVVRDIRANKVGASLATGNGSIILYGTCNEASFSMTGTGLIQADGLKAKSVKIKAVGTGQIGCFPSEELKIRGLAATRVFYKGSPEIINQSLGVKLEPLQ